MKLFTASISLLLLTSPAFAHPGRTDANGCHTGRAAFDNHCHRDSANTSSPSRKQPTNSGTTCGMIKTQDGDSVSLRKRPHEKIIAAIPSGERVRILPYGYVTGWGLVESQYGRGYVATTYIYPCDSATNNINL